MSRYKFFARLKTWSSHIETFVVRGDWFSCRQGQDLKREITLHLSEYFHGCEIEYFNVILCE